MMGMPLPINMIFPKIQEEFKKIIESGDMTGVTMSICECWVEVALNSGEVYIVRPEMEYDEVLGVVKQIAEALKNGK